MQQIKPASGYTLIELMIVAVLIGIAGYIAVPSMKNSNDNANLAGAARAMMGILQFARSEAINNNSIVNIETQSVTANNFTAQIIVCLAADKDATCGNKDDILRVERLDSYGAAQIYTLVNDTSKRLSFSQEGHLIGDVNVGIGICDGRPESESRRRYIQINPTGRALLLDYDRGAGHQCDSTDV